MLSSSDEETALTEDETEASSTNTPNGTHGDLQLETDLDEEMVQHLPSKERADGSPTEEESPDYWADINDELDAFLGSDAEDDSDAESVKSEAAIRLKTPPSAKKRKRDAEEDEGDGTADQAENEEGSRLQKRKKEALARSSSLTQMANVPSSNGSTPGAGDPGGREQEDEDDDLEALLEAEMSRQSDDEDVA